MHTNWVKILKLHPGEVLVIGYDKAKTTQYDLRTSKDMLAKMFPCNQVLLCPSNIMVEKFIRDSEPSFWKRLKRFV